MKKYIHILLTILLGMPMISCHNKTQGEHDNTDSIPLDSAAIARERAHNDSIFKMALMPTLDCLPFYYAQRMGLFEQAGIDVAITTYQAQMDVDTAFARSHADFFYTDIIRAALLQSQKKPLYVIMQADGDIQLLSTKNKRMRSIKHLKERTIGMARHSVTDLLLDTIIHEAKLDPSVVYHPQINDIFLRHDMLKNATLDAAFLAEPLATQSRLNGNRLLFNSNKLGLKFLVFAASYKATHQAYKLAQLQQVIEVYNQATQLLDKKVQRDTLRHILQDFHLQPRTIDTLALPKYKTFQSADKKTIPHALRFLRGRSLIHNYTADTLIADDIIKSVSSE